LFRRGFFRFLPKKGGPLAAYNSRAVNTTEDKPATSASGPSRVFTVRLVFCGDEVLTQPPLHTPTHGATPIGRETATGIALLRDRRASRLHATLHTGAGGTLHIVDERSRNGTLVNGQRVSEAVLKDGDVINIGDSYLVVRAEPLGLGDAGVPNLLGVSPAVRSLRSAIRRVAPTQTAVLLVGASGTGQEAAARALHALSEKPGAFVATSCSALTEDSARQLLAGSTRPDAPSSTLFLDEVADLPLPVQPLLLRALKDPPDRPLRILAASERDLGEAVKQGRLRADLYAHLAEILIHLPPLQARREDLLLLLLHALGTPAPRLTVPLVEALLLHDWLYNLREIAAVASQLRVCAAGAEVLGLELVADRLSRATSSLSSAAPESPGRVEVKEAPPPPTPPRGAEPLAGMPPLSLINEGEFWRLSAGKEVLRLKDAKGMRYLEHLLRHPEQEFHVLQLIALVAGGGDEDVGGDAGPLLDERARAAYRQRLEDLRDGLEEATQFGDHTRAARMQHEIDALTQQLAQAVGLGGRDRKAASNAERARINVQRRLRDAVSRITELHPTIGRYLAAALRTGTYCCYDPPKGLG
jgi:hypothetical protein